MIVAIFGPTASGKTDVAEALADRIGGELVSADAMQVYRGLPVLTNQSTRPSRLVGIWPLSHEASVAEYQELAHAAIDEILAAGERRSSSAARACTSGPRWQASTCHPHLRPGCAAAWTRSTSGSGRSGPTRSWPSAIRRRRPASTRTTAAASSARSSSSSWGARSHLRETGSGPRTPAIRP